MADNPNAPTSEEVLSIKHYTDKTFLFSLTRPPGAQTRRDAGIGRTFARETVVYALNRHRHCALCQSDT